MIQSTFKTLQKKYPDTRAMLETRSFVLRYAIDVPQLQAISLEVFAEVTAIITRISKPRTVDEVRPYTETFICTEYELKNTLTGKFRERTFFAVEMAMQDAKTLKAASYKIGDLIKVKLGSWEEQKHLHTLPLSDAFLDDPDIDKTRYFVFKSELKK